LIEERLLATSLRALSRTVINLSLDNTNNNNNSDFDNYSINSEDILIPVAFGPSASYRALVENILDTTNPDGVIQTIEDWYRKISELVADGTIGSLDDVLRTLEDIVASDVVNRLVCFDGRTFFLECVRAYEYRLQATTDFWLRQSKSELVSQMIEHVRTVYSDRLKHWLYIYWRSMSYFDAEFSVALIGHIMRSFTNQSNSLQPNLFQANLLDFWVQVGIILNPGEMTNSQWLDFVGNGEFLYSVTSTADIVEDHITRARAIVEELFETEQHHVTLMD